MKKEFEITFAGDEFDNYIYINCEEIIQHNKERITADGIDIEFLTDIISIRILQDKQSS